MKIEDGSPDARLLDYEDARADDVTEPAPPVPVEGYGEIEVEMARLSEEMQYGNLDEDQFAAQWFAYVQDTVKAQ